MLRLIFLLLFIPLCLWQIDLPLAIWLNQSLSIEVKAFARAVAVLGYALYSLAPLAILYGYYRYRDNQAMADIAAFLFLAIAISGICADILKVLLGRARPYQWFSTHEYGFYFWQFKANKWSFPSGHSTTVAALMTSMWLIIRRVPWLFIGVTLIVAASRMMTNHHYLSDVICGCLLGAICSQLLHHNWQRLRHSGKIQRL